MASGSASEDVPASNVDYIDALLYGTRWSVAGSDQPLTYGFGGSGQGRPKAVGTVSALDQDETQAAEEALAAVAAVADIEFVDSGAAGELQFLQNTVLTGSGSAARAYYPGDSGNAGDVVLDPGFFGGQYDVAPGTLKYMLLLHEIGHALGLKHPFEEAGASDVVLPAETDGHHYTVMSYSAWAGDESAKPDRYPTTLMLYDIAALQYLYGANWDYRAGDDVYVYSGDGEYFETIWDGGGSDTLVYDSAIGGVIDLRPGAFSTLGQPITYSNGAVDSRTVAIAYDCVIENAVGGAGADTLIGNDAANRLAGGAGDDSYVVGDPGDQVVELPGEGADAVWSEVSLQLSAEVENLTLTGAAVSGVGNALDNAITGNDQANRIGGGAGADHLAGGAGADVFVYLAPAHGGDTIVDFGAGDSFLFYGKGFANLPSGVLADQYFAADGVAHDADDRVLFDPASSSLWFDADGNGAGAAILIAVLPGVDALTAGTIVVG